MIDRHVEAEEIVQEAFVVADGVGVVGELTDGTTQRLNAGSFALYLNVTG